MVIHDDAQERPVAFRDPSGWLFADTCEPLTHAVARGDAELHALARGHYPGKRLADGEVDGIRTVGYWDVKGEPTWGLDWHRNEGIELTWVARGRVDFSVDDREFLLQPGDLTITRPWQRHRVGAPHVGPSRLYWLIVDVGVRRPNQRWSWPPWCLLEPALQTRLTESLQFHERAVWPAGEAVGTAFESLGSVIRAADLDTRATRIAIGVNELLVSVLEMLLERPVVLDRSLASARAAVEAFLDALPERLDAPWTLQSMAEACGLGRTRFTKYCKEMTNATPIEMLTEVRLQAAERLLCSTDATVTEIAYRCGFGSSQYFATVFRRHRGSTPTGFRAQTAQITV